MRIGFLRRKNTDLPLFNGRRNGTRSSSPHRNIPSRKHVLIGLVIVAVVLLLFNATSSPEPKRRKAETRFDVYYNAREDLFNNRLFFIKSVASVCTNLDPNSTFWAQAANRYALLGMDENADIGHKYYFALMLRDSANHLPTIIDNLLRVIYHLGDQNIFFSIYEGGSNDDGHTTTMIDTIKLTLEAIGIEFNIEVENTSSGNARDMVLKPLKEMYKTSERVFNTVVMMGDDLWCAEELLELIYHSRGQAASITCSTDVRADGDKFSISLGHDITGKLFQQGKISSYIADSDSLSRFKANYPLRVQSCFSSITILDPTPLYPPYDFNFVSSTSPTDNNLTPPGWGTRCGFSPELDFALHYISAGFSRAMLIPRSQTAKYLLDFFKLHRTEKELAEREQLHRQLGVWVEEDTGGKDNPFGKVYSDHENEIVWHISPKVADTFECKGERIKVVTPKKVEGGLSIHRELPLLNGKRETGES